jgi:hypothetical protein
MSTGGESMPEPSAAGSVVLDIGGDVGAALVYLPGSLAGREIEIREVSEPWQGQHVAVRERLLPDATVWAAVFPSLRAGGYEIRVRGGDPAGPTTRLSVSGGGVTALHWPAG